MAAALVGVAAGLVAVAPVVVAAGSALPHHGAPVVDSYVALGDSYTSGPAVPSQLGPTTTPPAPSSCLRSSDNYPSLTARALGLVLTDVSCAGATTGDLTGAQAAGVPPQLDAVRPATSVVSVGIGGNDLGFSRIVDGCLSATPWGGTRVGWSCARHDGGEGTDPLTTGVQQVGARVATVLADIRSRAPRARVFVIGYPEILPTTGSGCWPLLPFSGGDLGFLRDVESALNATLAQAAGSAGDTYVDMAGPSTAHNACTSADSRWVEPVLSSRHTFPLHPSAAGMEGMALTLEDSISPHRAG
jgi:lysophospholipase L1-like esterase